MKLFIFIVLATSIALGGASHSRRPRLRVCPSAACEETASLILANMDENVDPCDNFYQFACGNFTKNAVIRDDRSSTDLLSAINDSLQQKLRTTVENEVTDEDPKAFKLLQSYYDVCMNEEQIEKISDEEFVKILKELGGWPVLEGQSWNESKFDWKQTMYKLLQMGISFDQFISFGIGVDERNNTIKRINLDQATLGLPQQYLSSGSEQEIVKPYFKFMVDFAELFGANREEATKELKQSLEFEIALAKISQPESERRDRDKMYNPMTVSELQSKYPYLSWLDYINTILSPNELASTEVVIVAAPAFLDKLGELLSKTPSRVLANYVMWRVAKESSAMLSERVDKVRREFSASLTGNKTKSPRWQTCLSYAGGHLSPALGALYVRRHFSKQTKESALEMVNNIRKSYHKLLMKVDWMDPKTKKIAINKLAHMTPVVAYPEELFDDVKLDGHYEGLTVYPESFFKTVLKMNQFLTARAIGEFKQPVKRLDWTGIYGAAAMVNAFYNPSENAIAFPSAIIQGLVFNKDNPSYVNYAAMGVIAGHEMTHGFDDMGRAYDKYGNLADWWEPETKTEYLKRAKCIIDQYSGYKVEQVGLNLNGQLSQGENIADNGGVKEAYYAYDSYVRRIGGEPRLPGLEAYDNRQMFWISYANLWCTKYRPEYLKAIVTTDPHAPGEFRVVGPLSNRPEFARDFNCPAGAKMNPERRCSVW